MYQNWTNIEATSTWKINIKEIKKGKKTENFTVRVCSIFFPLLRLTAFLFYFIFYTLKHKTTTKKFSLRIIWTLLYILPTFTLIYVIQQQQQSCRAGSGFLYKKKKHIYKNCKIQFFLLFSQYRIADVYEHCFGYNRIRYNFPHYMLFFFFRYYYFLSSFFLNEHTNLWSFHPFTTWNNVGPIIFLPQKLRLIYRQMCHLYKFFMFILEKSEKKIRENWKNEEHNKYEQNGRRRKTRCKRKWRKWKIKK